jgi:hypothetical protein
MSYVLLTRAPLSIHPKVNFPFDLHVLGTPPAFILSQDQTLQDCFEVPDQTANRSFRCASHRFMTSAVRG